MTTMFMLIRLGASVLAIARIVPAFEIRQVFSMPKIPSIGESPVATQKKALLKAISNTNNGKNATPEQQAKVLGIVKSLESAQPPSPKLLSDPALAKKLLDGVWYLQYTSPSRVGDPDQFPDAWKPVAPTEGDSRIDTRQIEFQGSVSAAGIKVDTASRVVQQIFDVTNSQVTNLISLDDNGNKVRVSGTFRQSSNVPTRAIVAFDTAIISIFGGKLDINLGFFFALLAGIRKNKDNGWLETTYIDESMRIGRGNKGTLFVLTRDLDAVQP